MDRLDLEGGSQLTGLKARVEDPFQLVGMNALGLPGASIDGILGFTILARFRLEIDLTKDRMTWTRLDHDPRDPPCLHRQAGGEVQGRTGGCSGNECPWTTRQGAGVSDGQTACGTMQPTRVFGDGVVEHTCSGSRRVYIQRVLENLPAASGGIHAGDQIVRDQ